jgi:hypothetical protein
MLGKGEKVEQEPTARQAIAAAGQTTCGARQKESITSPVDSDKGRLQVLVAPFGELRPVVELDKWLASCPYGTYRIRLIVSSGKARHPMPKESRRLAATQFLPGASPGGCSISHEILA